MIQPAIDERGELTRIASRGYGWGCRGPDLPSAPHMILGDVQPRLGLSWGVAKGRPPVIGRGRAASRAFEPCSLRRGKHPLEDRGFDGKRSATRNALSPWAQSAS